MRRHRNDSGYVLMGIAVGLVVMGIFMGAAVPLWQHVIQREKEIELIWRGKQYVQAIARYQRKYPGAFPSKLEDLVEGKFLRKLYEDPMTEDGEWRVIRQMSPEARGLPGVGGDDDDEEENAASGRRGGAGRRTGSNFGRRGGDTALGGIVGVASTSDEESIKIYEGQEKYSEWLFVYTAPRNQENQVQPGSPRNPGNRGNQGNRGNTGDRSRPQPGQPPGGPGESGGRLPPRR